MQEVGQGTYLHCPLTLMISRTASVLSTMGAIWQTVRFYKDVSKDYTTGLKYIFTSVMIILRQLGCQGFFFNDSLQIWHNARKPYFKKNGVVFTPRCNLSHHPATTHMHFMGILWNGEAGWWKFTANLKLGTGMFQFRRRYYDFAFSMNVAMDFLMAQVSLWGYNFYS